MPFSEKVAKALAYAEHLQAMDIIAIWHPTCAECGHRRDGDIIDGHLWCHERSEHWPAKGYCHLNTNLKNKEDKK